MSQASRTVQLPTGVVVPSWVRLPDVRDPEDLETLTLQQVKKDVLEYECPVCGNRVRSDIAGLEPCCTGPDPYLDEHPMEPMRLLDPDCAATVVGYCGCPSGPTGQEGVRGLR